jgi:hypothetical protein
MKARIKGMEHGLTGSLPGKKKGYWSEKYPHGCSERQHTLAVCA